MKEYKKPIINEEINMTSDNVDRECIFMLI